MISDQTPWQDLEASGVGAAIPLEKPQRFVDWLRRYAVMDAESFQELSDRAIRYAYEHSNLEEMAQKYREMLEYSGVCVRAVRSEGNRRIID